MENLKTILNNLKTNRNNTIQLIKNELEKELKNGKKIILPNEIIQELFILKKDKNDLEEIDFSHNLDDYINLENLKYNKLIINQKTLDFFVKNRILFNPSKTILTIDMIHEGALQCEELQQLSFEGVIFDSSNDSFRNVVLTDLNFSGSIEANLDPQIIDGLWGIRNVKLKDVNILGGELAFDNVFCHEVDFKGSKGAIINPQTVKKETLEKCKLCDVIIIGGERAFRGIQIEGTDFAGSKGAIIDPRIIYMKSLKRTKLKDATIIGGPDAINDVKIYGTDFTGSKGAWINLDVPKKDLKFTNFKDATLFGDLNRLLDTHDTSYRTCIDKAIYQDGTILKGESVSLAISNYHLEHPGNYMLLTKKIK